MPEPSSEALQRLSKREHEALFWAGAPMSSPEIARAMGDIMPDTVDKHIKRACAKLGTSDRRQAARMVRASLACRTIPETWVSQTLGDVTAAAAVLDQARCQAETEPPREHSSPELDARGGRDDAPAPGPGIGPGDGPPPLPQPPEGAQIPDAGGDPGGGHGGRGGGPAERPAVAPGPGLLPRGGAYGLIRLSGLQKVALAAVGAPLLALVVVSLLLAAILLFQTFYYGPR